MDWFLRGSNCIGSMIDASSSRPRGGIGTCGSSSPYTYGTSFYGYSNMFRYRKSDPNAWFMIIWTRATNFSTLYTAYPILDRLQLCMD